MPKNETISKQLDELLGDDLPYNYRMIMDSKFEFVEPYAGRLGEYPAEIYCGYANNISKVVKLLKDLGCKSTMSKSDLDYYLNSLETEEERSSYLKNYFNCDNLESAKKGEYILSSAGGRGGNVQIILTKQEIVDKFKEEINKALKEKNEKKLSQKFDFSKIEELLSTSSKAKKLTDSTLSKEDIVSKFPELQSAIKEVERGVGMYNLRIYANSSEDAEKIKTSLELVIKPKLKIPTNYLIFSSTVGKNQPYVLVNDAALEELKNICKGESQEKGAITMGM
jgi:hypothetical protein